ncbi:MAG: hypothetical protein U0575_00990 [Phycisphaerales bacterium]
MNIKTSVIRLAALGAVLAPFVGSIVHANDGARGGGSGGSGGVIGE